MNHDITHCVGTGCSKKGTCLRYLAHRELEEDPKYTYMLVSYMQVPEEPCYAYLEVKDEKKRSKR